MACLPLVFFGLSVGAAPTKTPASACLKPRIHQTAGVHRSDNDEPYRILDTAAISFSIEVLSFIVAFVYCWIFFCNSPTSFVLHDFLERTSCTMTSQEQGAMPKILWKHPNPQSTQMYKFKKMIEKKRGVNLSVWRPYTYHTTSLKLLLHTNP